MMSMIASVAELFKGTISIESLLNMDIPKMKALMHGQLRNIQKSREELEKNGSMDHYATNASERFLRGEQ